MRHPTHLIERWFYSLGLFIGTHPKRIILTVLIVSFVASLGLLNFEETNNVRSEYSPLNAPSKKEYLVAKEFLKQNGSLDPCYVMVQAQDGGSLLRDPYRMLVHNLTKALQNEVEVMKKGRRYLFKDFCAPYCELNSAFLAFMRLYDAENPSTFTYPSIYLFGTRAFIGNNVYGIELNTKKEEEEDEPTMDKKSNSEVSFDDRNEEESENLKHLKGFTTAVLPFYLVASYEDTDMIIAWQTAAIKLFERPEYSTWLKTGMTGDNLVSYEVRRMGIETGPLIFGSIAAMMIFVVLTSFRVNATESKPWEAFIGCLIPLLAMLTSMGIMSALGMKFQSIIVAAIFLVLSVGVDDIFIIMRAWHRAGQPVSFTLPAERMANCLEDAGPSITISSLTNVICFAIGALSDTPAVRTFCIFSAVAITICYVYQLILLTAIIVVLSVRREQRGYQSFLCCLKANPQSQNNFMSIGEIVHRRVVEYWAAAVTRWPTRLLLLLLMCGYFYVSWVGISRMESNISIDKMALPDSYLHSFQTSFESALRNMQPISVFVMNPGDLRDPKQLKRIKSLVYDFEHTLNAYGAESTFFWIPQYEDFLRFYVGAPEEDEAVELTSSSTLETQFSYTEFPAFFKSTTYFYLSTFVRLNESACLQNSPECVSSFFFITNFRDVIKYHELVPTVRDWRRVCDEYKDLQVYAYSDHTPFVDQTMSIDQTVVGSVIAALACTAFICLIFIPHLLSVLAAVFSVFSISFGIFGLLSLWQVNLDPLSMAALIMAIGFSVDFTAHISYHYYKASKGNPRRRMQAALNQIGWPMCQVGLSTIVALLPLLFKQSYLAMVFLKTIVVVVLLGMFHGLVLLPAVLTFITFEKERRICGFTFGKCSKKQKQLKKCGVVETGGESSSGSNSTTSSQSDSSSERSSQRSTTRKESFYKNQHLIKSLNKEFDWANKPKGFFTFSNVSSTSSTVSSTNIRAKSRSFSHKGVAQLSVTDLNAYSTMPCNYALVHKITLNRSNSK